MPTPGRDPGTTHRGSSGRPPAWRRRSVVAAALSLVLGLTGAVISLQPKAVQASCPPTLGNFEIEGNLIVDCSPALDWANVNTVSTVDKAIDLPSGPTDNSFGQGAKEDGTTVNIVTGSIPPNKNDLTRMYEASQFINGTPFLYIAWERLVNIGSADIDFEFNQATQPFTASTTGPVNLVRTPGDLLVLFEFSGSGSPVIQTTTWTGSVWGPLTTLNSANALAAVNTGTVTDPLNSNASLGAGLFGEASINLAATGAFQQGTCEKFGSVYTKARSSGSSFDSELKDFIAPTQVNLSNCQPSVLTLKKVDNSGHPLSGAVMQLFKDTDKDDTLASFSLDSSDTQVAPDNPTAGTSDCTTGSDGIGNCVYTFSATAANGLYIGHEKTPPSGYGGAPDQATLVSVSQTGHSVTLTYVDTPLAGQINVVKKNDAGDLLAGAQFTLYQSDGTTVVPSSTVGTNPCTTSSSGTCSFTNVPLGTYVVTETTAPSGYSASLAQPSTSQTVTIGLGSGSSGQTKTVTFTDPVRATIGVQKNDDSSPANPLSGATFVLEDSQGNPIAGETCTTGNSGGCTFPNQVGLGTYTVHETVTPAGHATAPDQQTTITSANAGQTVTLTFVDPVRASIGVQKNDDSSPANPLSGATFVLEDSQGNPIAGETCTTGNSGGCTFPNSVGLGTYIVHESVTPAGHATAPDQQTTITSANAGQTVTLTFVDPVRASIGVQKNDDSSPPNPLSGATFVLEDSGGNPIAGETCTTNNSGGCVFPNQVGLGTYIVHESVTPAGHATAPDQQTTITAANAGQIVTLTFVDPVRASIGVQKNDDSSPANPLSGATFVLEDSGGNPIAGETCTTGNTGACVFPNQVGLGTYIVHETVTPAGHASAPDQQVIISAVDAGQTVTLTFVDPVLANIEVTKVDDAVPANTLAGASFQLLNASNIVVQTCGPTTSNGLCDFTNVHLGTYTVHESVTPTGYTTAADQQVTITAANAGQTVHLTFVDPRQFRIITIVCQEGSSPTLYPTSITLDNGQTLTSISSSQAAALGLTDSTVCGITGAAFPHQPAGSHSLSMHIS